MEKRFYCFFFFTICRVFADHLGMITCYAWLNKRVWYFGDEFLMCSGPNHQSGLFIYMQGIFTCSTMSTKQLCFWTTRVTSKVQILPDLIRQYQMHSDQSCLLLIFLFPILTWVSGQRSSTENKNDMYLFA